MTPGTAQPVGCLFVLFVLFILFILFILLVSWLLASAGQKNDTIGVAQISHNSHDQITALAVLLYEPINLKIG